MQPRSPASISPIWCRRSRRRLERRGHRLDLGRGDDHRHADPAVEGARHLLGLDTALRLQERHQPRLRPGIGIDLRVEALGQDARDVLEQAAAGDVRQPLDLALRGSAAAGVFT